MDHKKVKRFLLFLAAFLFLACVPAQAQLIQSQTFAATSTLNNGLVVIGQNVSVYNVKWQTSGTVSTCTFTIDTAPDNATWSTGGAIPSTTCTAGSGSVTVYNVTQTSVSYVRINLSTFTGTVPGITITLTAYPNSIAAAPINTLVLSTATITPAATSAAIQTVAQAFTLTGITATEKLVLVSQPTPTSLCPAVAAAGQAANSVNIFFTVLTAVACTPASGVYTFMAVR